MLESIALTVYSFWISLCPIMKMAHCKHSGLTSLQEKVIHPPCFASHHQLSHSFMTFCVLPRPSSRFFQRASVSPGVQYVSPFSLLDCKYHISRPYTHRYSTNTCMLIEWQKISNSSRNIRGLGLLHLYLQPMYDSLVSLTSLPILLLLGAACAVCASQVCRPGNDQWHDQRGGWAPAASVPPHLHSSLWECQVRMWHPTLVSMGSMIRMCLPLSSRCFEFFIYLINLLSRANSSETSTFPCGGWKQTSENLIIFADWFISILKN